MEQTDILFVISGTEQIAKEILDISRKRDSLITHDFAYNLDEALNELENNALRLVYVTSMFIPYSSNEHLSRDFLRTITPLLAQPALAPASRIICTAKKLDLIVLANSPDPIISDEFQKIGAIPMNTYSQDANEQYQTINRLLQNLLQKIIV